MSPKRFLFIRHGETDWNAEGRLQGQRDIPLNATGRAQAAAAGKRAAGVTRSDSSALDPIDMVVSPLGRTRATAEIARAAMGLDPTAYRLDERLKEFSFGDWEGLTWAEVKGRDPLLVKARRRDKWRFVPPGGESYADLVERVRPWLDEVSDGSIVVSHGGVARALLVLIGGVSTVAAPDTDIMQGRVLLFERGAAAWR